MIDLHVAWEQLNFSPNHTAAQKSGDEQFLHRNRSFIWFCHCASLFDYLIRPHHHHRGNNQAKSLGGLEVD